VAGFLFNSAKNGNVTAQIFWLKTRARWKEVPAEFKYSEVIGTFDVNSDEDLERISRKVCEAALAHNVFPALVGSQPEINAMAHFARVRPLSEFNLRDKRRDPG
jgi:hypothetical protein